MSNKILLVDDEPHILRSLQFKLERVGGYEIITASDGEEAMAMIEKEKPCLVFLDIMLPKKNGYEVCQWVKNKLEFWDTYVIMLSAKGQRDEVVKGLDCGADEYMTKPFDPNQVLERTQRLMEEREGVID